MANYGACLQERRARTHAYKIADAHLAPSTQITQNTQPHTSTHAHTGDLAGFIRAASASGRPLPEATVWQIFLQLCQGVNAVHDTCVIHRDIKPANIFMCPDNIVKVRACFVRVLCSNVRLVWVPCPVQLCTAPTFENLEHSTYTAHKASHTNARAHLFF